MIWLVRASRAESGSGRLRPSASAHTMIARALAKTVPSSGSSISVASTTDVRPTFTGAVRTRYGDSRNSIWFR